MSDWTKRLRGWAPPGDWRRIVTVDAHAEGEPLRVVIAGFPALRGQTVLDRRRDAGARCDAVRRTLMWEPRGHADMYGCIVGPPVTGEADLSVLFTHNDGFSTMCGHGIIGVVTVLLETGLLPIGGDGGPQRDRDVSTRAGGGPQSEEATIGIDTPAGFVRARASREDGRVRSVSFVNVPSFASRLDARVPVADVGPVRYDLAYGGAFYAYVTASDFGLTLVPGETDQLIDLGRRIKDAIQGTDPPSHPDADDLGFMYGTIFVGEALEEGHHSRNVCVFADGEVDRSPTGTGVSGRLALHHARGELPPGRTIVVESILGTRFSGTIVGSAEVGGLPAVIPEISGRAWITGVNELLVDPTDPLAEGFLLR